MPHFGLPPCVSPYIVNEPFPVPRDLIPVAHLLASLGYTPRAIDGALSDIHRHGSAWVSSWVDDEDLAEVEALVVGQHPDQWPEWTTTVVSLP